jgi:hypothetical protein
VTLKPAGRPAAADTPKPPPFVITSTKSEEKWLKVLLYGIYGVGKTSLSITAMEVPEMNDVLFVNAESGELSLPNGVDKVDVGTYATVARVFEFLRLHVRYRDENNEEGLWTLQRRLFGPNIYQPERLRKYRTIIIDSLTEVQTYLMYQLLNVDMNNWQLDIAPESPEFKEWGQSSEMIQLQVRLFRDLKMHVIFVCSEQEVTDNNRLLKRPNLPGKLANKVQGFLDVVGYLDAAINSEGDSVRRLWLQPGHGKFQAKHRFRNHPNLKYIDLPDMKQLLDLTKETPTNASTNPSNGPSNTNGNTTRAEGSGSRTGSGAGSGTSGSGSNRGAVRGGPVRRTGGPVRRG